MLDGRPPGGPADSDGEVLLLELLRDAGVPVPVRQHQMGGYRFDLVWPRHRVAVELDGARHRSAQQLHRDDLKQNRAALAGWVVLRFTWARVVGEPEQVVAEVLAALGRAGRRAVS